MKKMIIAVLIVFFTLGLLSCKDKVNLPNQPLKDYIQIYMPQAANGTATFNFNTGDTSSPVIVYGANYGGYGYPDRDIEVHFDVDQSMVDSFNTANGTNYLLLPAESYSLSETSSIIPQGSLSTEPLKVTIHTTGQKAPGDISKTYILPIQLQSGSININPALQTYFCLINIIPTFFDRSQWKVVDFSSEEAEGEGPANGRAIFALDGNKNTYWHTAWKNSRPGPPHYITVDMGESKRILGSAVTDRQNVNSGRPEQVEYYVSENGTDWEKAYTGTLLNTGDQQMLFFKTAVQGRYIKFQVNSIYSSDITNLAELNLF